jgi:hypothetical protein
MHYFFAVYGYFTFVRNLTESSLFSFLLVVTSYLISSLLLVMKMTACIYADLHIHFPVHLHDSQS